ncbi:hypothetical protein I4U23_027213 [Adineta vaga]|nr:hypothetical protein I4U23_027213 [Adineta vaga]
MLMDLDKQIIFKFRFEISDKVVHLTKQELIRIPYLFALVRHQNEYLLHYPICYNWFMPILHSIKTGKPYDLFKKLSKHENILNVLELFDYLCINLFPSPLLSSSNIRLLNPLTNKIKEQRISYRQTNNNYDVHNTTAAFILALTKHEYDLNDYQTIQSTFSLISAIFSYGNSFSSRFLYHTYTILDEYLRHINILIFGPPRMGKSDIIRELLGFTSSTDSDTSDLLEDTTHDTTLLETNSKGQQVSWKQTQSRLFIRSPKRSKFNQFKPRYGPKTQKYR